jgi:hypothetical protein
MKRRRSTASRRVGYFYHHRTCSQGYALDTFRTSLLGWSGRAPAPAASDAVRGTKGKEHAMAETPKNSIAFVGIDTYWIFGTH